MKAKVVGVKAVLISGDFIRLDSFLKYVGSVPTGGAAKNAIDDGLVFINGSVCTVRGKKLRGGDIVRFGGDVFSVKAAKT